jgi:hypothetical protein
VRLLFRYLNRDAFMLQAPEAKAEAAFTKLVYESLNDLFRRIGAV